MNVNDDAGNFNLIWLERKKITVIQGSLDWRPERWGGGREYPSRVFAAEGSEASTQVCLI